MGYQVWSVHIYCLTWQLGSKLQVLSSSSSVGHFTILDRKLQFNGQTRVYIFLNDDPRNPITKIVRDSRIR